MVWTGNLRCEKHPPSHRLFYNYTPKLLFLALAAGPLTRKPLGQVPL